MHEAALCLVSSGEALKTRPKKVVQLDRQHGWIESRPVEGPSRWMTRLIDGVSMVRRWCVDGATGIREALRESAKVRREYPCLPAAKGYNQAV